MTKIVASLSPSAQELSERKKKLKEKHWYALRVHVQQERRLVEIFKTRGYEAFVPIRQEKHRWSDRIKVVDIVLTTGIIFLKTSMDKFVDAFVNKSVKCFINSPGDNKPCPISDECMENFRRMVDKNYEFKLTLPMVGETVMVVDGPLKGLVGVLVKAEPKDAMKPNEKDKLFVRMNDVFGAVMEIEALKVHVVPKGTKSILPEMIPEKFVDKYKTDED